MKEREPAIGVTREGGPVDPSGGFRRVGQRAARGGASVGGPHSRARDGWTYLVPNISMGRLS
jgi:hypothetical protein